MDDKVGSNLREKEKAKTKALTHTYVLKRLFITFLPHFHIFLAMLVTSSIYAGVMTARVALIYPVMRVFAREVSPEDAKKYGAAGERIIRPIVNSDGEFSSSLGELNEFLDGLDQKLYGAIEPILPKRVRDSELKKAQVGALASVVFLFLMVALVAAATNISKIYLKALLVVRVLIYLRVKLLKNLLDQPLAFYNEQKRGELISRMSNDVGSATVALNILTGDMIQQPLLMVGPILLVVAGKWWFGVFVAFYLGVVTLSLRKQTRKVHRRAKVRQRAIAKVTEAMVQMFAGIRVVKAFGLEKAKVEQYTERNNQFARDALATDVAKAWTRTRMEFITNMILVLVMIVAAFVLGAGGDLPAGAMIIFLALMTQLYGPAKKATRALAELIDHLAGAGRVFEFMDLEPGTRDKPGAIACEDVVGTVRFEDVSFAYDGNGKVLDHINLEVPAGEVVALVGPSGAGKSTLVNLVPRFYDTDEGTITLDGTDIREFQRDSLLHNIAIVTQEPFLFNVSIRENIAYGKPGATLDEVEAAAKAANIHDFVSQLPRGYESFVGERGANLSGGQCQRITIARALIRDPKILILDEATSSLDTESERAVQQALDNLMKGRTTLVIAHRLSTVQHADKICVVQDGRIAEVGSHDQLMASETLYRRLYELQFAR